MPDITMCPGLSCPLKKQCYRYTAMPSHWQAYFCNLPYNFESKSCIEFWSNSDRDVKEEFDDKEYWTEIAKENWTK